jgi:hypothetical protein
MTNNGLFWQIAPAIIAELRGGDDKNRVEWVTQAFLKMKKFDIGALRRGRMLTHGPICSSSEHRAPGQDQAQIKLQKRMYPRRQLLSICKLPQVTFLL